MSGRGVGRGVGFGLAEVTFSIRRFLRRRALRSLVDSEPMPGGTVWPFVIDVLRGAVRGRAGLREDCVSGSDSEEDESESLSELVVESESELELELELELEVLGDGAGASLGLFGGLSSAQSTVFDFCLTMIRSLSLRMCASALESSRSNASSSRARLVSLTFIEADIRCLRSDID